MGRKWLHRQKDIQAGSEGWSCWPMAGVLQHYLNVLCVCLFVFLRGVCLQKSYTLELSFLPNAWKQQLRTIDSSNVWDRWKVYHPKWSVKQQSEERLEGKKLQTTDLWVSANVPRGMGDGKIDFLKTAYALWPPTSSWAPRAHILKVKTTFRPINYSISNQRRAGMLFSQSIHGSKKSQANDENRRKCERKVKSDFSAFFRK